MDATRPSELGGWGAPGWDTITNAVGAMHPGVEPLHFAMASGVRLGAPLDGISAYRAIDHWHLVTYGLTELFFKESDDAELSERWEALSRCPWTFEVAILPPTHVILQSDH